MGHLPLNGSRILPVRLFPTTRFISEGNAAQDRKMIGMGIPGR
jgi:hypothetical protein